MRTTLNLDGDVLDRARNLASQLGKPFRFIINEAMRSGLNTLDKTRSSKIYRMPSRNMGLRSGVSLENVGELLEKIEEHEKRS